MVENARSLLNCQMHSIDVSAVGSLRDHTQLEQTILLQLNLSVIFLNSNRTKDDVRHGSPCLATN